MPQPHGQQIEAIRVATGITRDQLAGMVGKSYTTIHGIEKYSASTSIETLYRIALVLKTPIQTVMVQDRDAA